MINTIQYEIQYSHVHGMYRNDLISFRLLNITQVINHDSGYVYYQGNNYNLGYKHNLGHDL